MRLYNWKERTWPLPQDTAENFIKFYVKFGPLNYPTFCLTSQPISVVPVSPNSGYWINYLLVYLTNGYITVQNTTENSIKNRSVFKCIYLTIWGSQTSRLCYNTAVLNTTASKIATIPEVTLACADHALLQCWEEKNRWAWSALFFWSIENARLPPP